MKTGKIFTAFGKAGRNLLLALAIAGVAYVSTGCIFVHHDHHDDPDHWDHHDDHGDHDHDHDYDHQ